MTHSTLLSDPLARFTLQNLFFLLIAAIISQTAEAATISLTRITNPSIATQSVERPVYVTTAPGESDRLFVLESHTGNIQILKKQSDGSWQKNSQAFLSLSDNGINVSTGNEQGLLGMAFHPDYQTNGKFYVSYTSSGQSHTAEFSVSSGNADLADNSSYKSVISFNRNRSNHNGGWIGFGTDNYLYIPTGDSGGGNDPDNVAQNLNELRGKILRIDVNGDDFAGDNTLNYAIPDDNPFINDPNANDAIWAYGLRNPWRASFDRATGDFYIADVGQNNLEEINLQSALSMGGENYGWDIKEGLTVIGTPPPGFNPIDPIHQYSHNPNDPDFGGFSITGGYVYRADNDGSELQGKYLFADFVSNKIWSLYFDESGNKVVEEITDDLFPDAGVINQIASFGEDANGNIYIVGLDGEIFLFDAMPVTAVPVPAAFYLMLSGILGLFGIRKQTH